MNEEKAKLVNEKAKQLADLVDYARVHFPLIAEKVNAQTHNVKAKYGGLIALMASVCALAEVVLG